MAKERVAIKSRAGYVYQVRGIQPKQWPAGGYDVVSMSAYEEEYFQAKGVGLRVITGDQAPLVESLAVKITIAKDDWKYATYGGFEVACKIEFPGDGEPSSYTTGKLFFDSEPVLEVLPQAPAPQPGSNVFKMFGQELQIDAQEKAAEQIEADQQAAYIELNNLYLEVENKKNLTREKALRMLGLVCRAYNQGDPMREYWEREFQKLPRWYDF